MLTSWSFASLVSPPSCAGSSKYVPFLYLLSRASGDTAAHTSESWLSHSRQRILGPKTAATAENGGHTAPWSGERMIGRTAASIKPPTVSP